MADPRDGTVTCGWSWADAVPVGWPPELVLYQNADHELILYREADPSAGTVSEFRRLTMRFLYLEADPSAGTVSEGWPSVNSVPEGWFLSLKADHELVLYLETDT